MDSDLKFLVGSKITVTVWFCLLHVLSWSRHRHRIKTVKGPKPSHDRKLLPLEYRLRMLIVKTPLLPPSLKCALGRWVKDVLKIRDWLLPEIKAIQRYRPEYHEKWSCLLHSQKGDSFVQHRLHLRTWWWKWLQEAREVHSPQRLWIFWRNPALLFKSSGSKMRWRPAGHH